MGKREVSFQSNLSTLKTNSEELGGLGSSHSSKLGHEEPRCTNVDQTDEAAGFNLSSSNNKNTAGNSEVQPPWDCTKDSLKISYSPEKNGLVNSNFNEFKQAKSDLKKCVLFVGIEAVYSDNQSNGSDTQRSEVPRLLRTKHSPAIKPEDYEDSDPETGDFLQTNVQGNIDGEQDTESEDWPELRCIRGFNLSPTERDSSYFANSSPADSAEKFFKDREYRKYDEYCEGNCHNDSEECCSEDSKPLISAPVMKLLHQHFVRFEDPASHTHCNNVPPFLQNVDEESLCSVKSIDSFEGIKSLQPSEFLLAHSPRSPSAQSPPVLSDNGSQSPDSPSAKTRVALEKPRRVTERNKDLQKGSLNLFESEALGREESKAVDCSKLQNSFTSGTDNNSIRAGPPTELSSMICEPPSIASMDREGLEDFTIRGLESSGIVQKNADLKRSSPEHLNVSWIYQEDRKGIISPLPGPNLKFWGVNKWPGLSSSPESQDSNVSPDESTRTYRWKQNSNKSNKEPHNVCMSFLGC